MTIENANDHPLKVAIVKDEGVHANSHPYKVAIVEGGAGGGGEARVVETLPDEGEVGYIYLVLKKTTKAGDIYDEYLWALQEDGKTYGWEHIGATNEVSIKLYDELGNNTDGAITQRAATEALGKFPVKELTEADYNYPTNNPQRIAFWLLDEGFYKTKAGVSMSLVWSIHQSPIEFLVLKDDNNNVLMFTTEVVSRNYNVRGNEVIGYVKRRNASGPEELKVEFVDNLTTSTIGSALDARQGKVLNDKIGGDLANLTTENKTNLISAINENVAKIGDINTVLATLTTVGE